jgi:excisionase family DNA binding protein
MNDLHELSSQGALPKLLLTVGEAAQALSLSRTSVYGLVMCKQIFSIKVRGSRRIPVKALEEFVERLSELQRAG